MMDFAVVIPVAPGRRQNLVQVLECIAGQSLPPKVVALVCDGPDAHLDGRSQFSLPTVVVQTEKHEPGREQPRNIGVRAALAAADDKPELTTTHVAFLDSDILIESTFLEDYAVEIERGGEDGVYYGPYEWMPPGQRSIMASLKNDGRWPMFESHVPGARYQADLSKGLGCFSGNLVWNIEDFKRVGGFWNELHMGRCEDGELGLRATHMGIRIGLVPEARGWHLDHPRNMEWIKRTNSIDVPKINERHPWVELGEDGTELFVIDEDGKRFEARCACGWSGNTAHIWTHQETHR